MATLQDYLGITKLRDAWPKWKANVVAVNNQVIDHVAGSADKHLTSDITNDSEEAGTTTADAINTNKAKVADHIAGTADKHSAQDITYTGDFVGKTEVKAALDQAKTEIDTIVVNASIDPEVAFARDSAVKSKVFGSLDARLEEDEQDFESYRADNTIQLDEVDANILELVTDKANQSDLIVTNETVALKAFSTYVDQQIANVASGSPKGAYATLADLETAFPTGDTGIYVITFDGNWYYWDSSAWVSGGLYQSTEWIDVITIQNAVWGVI